LLSLLADWDTDDAGLEELLHYLDLTITLRVLADRPRNRSLPLRWQHHDLLESGWATLDDLTDIDRPVFILTHTALFRRLQDHVGWPSVNGIDTWLAQRGIPQTTTYAELNQDGTVTQKHLTLPVAVRNMIHHPENTGNALSGGDLRESLELTSCNGESSAEPNSRLELVGHPTISWTASSSIWRARSPPPHGRTATRP
jgi:hypothetical protein